MDSKDIIEAIDEFFMTADESALAEVTAALSTNIDGDISIEEYLSGFSNELCYTESPESNVYTDKRLNPHSHLYL